MKQNKILPIILVCILIISLLAGCGIGSSKKISTAKVDVELLRCSFDNEVTASDKEYINSSYPEIDGKVYVDLVLKIKNKNSADFTQNDISGYFMYNDVRYDLQYDLESLSGTSFDNKNIPPSSVGIVHMFNRVEKAAENTDITVKYTVDGKECETKVAAMDKRDNLQRKTKVSVGNKINANGMYDIEILDCSLNTAVQATKCNDEREQLSATNGQASLDLVLKIKNNSAYELIDVRGYTVIDGEVSRAENYVETENNTKLDDLTYNGIAIGEEGIVHVLDVVDWNVDKSNLFMRFNLGGNCYYCPVK